VPDPITAAAGQTVQLDPSLLLGSTDRSASKVLDKDAFLKLLVAQLRYQDPMNPSSNEQFIATTAQFTTIEKLDELAQHAARSSQISGIATASALVGRQVTVLDATGQPRTTTVTRGQVVGGQLSLVTELGTVGLDEVLAVGPPPAAAGPPSATSAPITTDPTNTDPANTAPTTTEPTNTDTSDTGASSGTTTESATR
jgi:flagellar basal-body rod modification protein FlgD